MFSLHNYTGTGTLYLTDWTLMWNSNC